MYALTLDTANCRAVSRVLTPGFLSIRSRDLLSTQNPMGPIGKSILSQNTLEHFIQVFSDTNVVYQNIYIIVHKLITACIYNIINFYNALIAEATVTKPLVAEYFPNNQEIYHRKTYCIACLMGLHCKLLSLIRL